MPVRLGLKILGEALTSFVYPPACLWCGDPLAESEAGHASRFCESCDLALAPPIPHRCQRCSAPVGPHLAALPDCGYCRDDRFNFVRAISIGPYVNELRSACLKCKQPGQAPLTRGLTELLCQREGTLLKTWKGDVVIPVPHYVLDRIWHAHHASDAVAETLGKFLGVPVERHLLAKVKWTKRQLKLSMSARRENLRSAFRVAGRGRLDGVHVLLADDILTTGTTAHRASRALLDAGAASVHVAVLARALGN